MLPLQKFIQKDKPRMDAKIKAYYQSYKNFICCEDLPDFDVLYTDSSVDKSITYKAQVHLYQNPIVLKCNIARLDEKDLDFRATLVHEFTHIYDYHVLSKRHDNEFLRRNMLLYSEKHAVEIEILFCYNIVNKITDRVDIMKANMVTLLELPVKKNQTYADWAIKYYKNPTLHNFHNAKTTYMYACGASSILSQLLDRQMRVIDFAKDYQAEMNKAVTLLMKIKYNEIPSKEVLSQIGDINKRLNAIYISHHSK